MKRSLNKVSRSPFLPLLVIFIAGLLQILFGETIPVANGLGFDGRIYGSLVMNFQQEMATLPLYLVGRVLPSFCVVQSLTLLNIPANAGTVVKAFQAFNFVMLLLAGYGWVLISENLKISRKGQWLGFLAFFVNFAMLKSCFFEPVVTDAAAFTLTVYALYFFLSRNDPGLVCVAVLGAFTWPLVMLVALLLYVFPRETLEIVRQDNPASRFFSAAATITFLLAVTLNFSVTGSWLVLAGLLCALLYIYWGAQKCLNFRGCLKTEKISVLKAVCSALLVLAYAWISVNVGHSSEKRYLENLFLTTLSTSIVRPFNFLVAHIVWYGPAVILVIFLWEPVCRTMRQYGPGVLTVLIGGFVLSVSAVSRHLIVPYVFFVVYMVKTLETRELPGSFLMIFTLISVAYSKIWLKMDVGPWTGGPSDLSVQRYWMSHGQMMSGRFYLIQGVVVLGTVFLFAFLLKRGSKRNGGPFFF